MQRNFNSVCAVLILIAGAMSRCNLAGAQEAQTQSAPSLEEQLNAQFTTIKNCGDNGTLLSIQQTGITGFPQTDRSTPAAKYRDGKLHSPTISFGGVTLKKNFEPLGVGLKVYPTSIVVNASKDAVTISILACNIGYKGAVVFEFAKGSLQKMGVPEVMDTISKVFAFDQSGDPGPQARQQAPQSDQQQPESTQSPTPEPPKVQIGQTPDEVIAALGQPDKKIDLGAKKIFIYKDVKITFKDGKVADAE